MANGYIDPDPVLLNRGLNWGGAYGPYGQSQYANQSAIMHGIKANAQFAENHTDCLAADIDSIKDIQEVREILRGFATIQEEISRNAMSTAKNFSDVQLENCKNTAELSKQLAKCCCDNQLGLEQVKNNQAQMELRLTSQANENTTKIIDAINQQTVQDLRDQNSDLKFAALRNEIASGTGCRFPGGGPGKTV